MTNIHQSKFEKGLDSLNQIIKILGRQFIKNATILFEFPNYKKTMSITSCLYSYKSI